MKKIFCFLVMLTVFVSGVALPARAAADKLKILVVSSYHREYLWSQETNKGLCAAFKDFKFLDTDQQVEEFTKDDRIETDTVIIKKAWMDTKRKSKKDEIKASAAAVTDLVKEFKPDLVFLGDDNAVNFVGARLVNTPTPVVFWGVDLYPMRYGYLDSLEHPGRNVTGVYQSGYYKECLENLLKLVPSVKTFAILSDDSETGRAKSGAIALLAEGGKVPLTLVDRVATDSFAEWKTRAQELAGKVDAFFVVNHSTLKDEEGSSVDSLKVGAWYLANIKKPEAVPEEQFVKEGMLVTADDAGYKQGYEAGRMADMILHQKKAPGDIAVISPSRGKIISNKLRAQALGIDLTGKDFIEEVVDGSKALEKFPQQ
ncbi:MAG: ABC transporter substrate binding protein [Candidatus Omnitrophota bacterium]